MTENVNNSVRLPQKSPAGEPLPRSSQTEFYWLPSSSGQFSLRGLLWFALACSVYWAQLGTVWDAAHSNRELNWIDGLTTMVTWLILVVFYLRSKLRFALLYHCAILLLVGVVIAINVLVDSVSISIVLFITPCFAGSFVSLPMAMLSMFGSALEHHCPKPRGRMP